MQADKQATSQPTLKVKRERTSINGTRALLEVRGKEAGFHYAWINGDHVDARRENGFEHVRHAVQIGAKRIDVSTMPQDQFVSRNVGMGVIAYLMRIPQEFYDEDMAALQNEVDERTKAQIRGLSSDGVSGGAKVTQSSSDPA